MSRFRKDERVQIVAINSGYRLRYGTVMNTDHASVSVLIDGNDKTMRFWDTELIPARHVPAPGKELTHTQKYLRELDEDTKQLFETAGLYPQGSNVQKDAQAFASYQAKIVSNLKLTLKQDGVALREAEDANQ